jgi:hypothetical protein
MNNEPIAEAIKYAAVVNDLILIGALCRLLTHPCMETFNKLSPRLHGISDTLAVQDLHDWVMANKKESI